MQTYVVRIYRRDANDLENLIGIIEEVETGSKYEFRNLEELIAVLTGSQESKAGRLTKKATRYRLG